MAWSKQTIPLLASEPSAGSINLSFLQDPSTLDTLFSYTMYIKGTMEKFKSTSYYHALLIYAKIIHNTAYSQFAGAGMILYTDTPSVPLLEELFGDFPKVIIAEVIWPHFTIDGGKVDETVMRCMRFQALEAFPNKLILVRDADSLFPYEIMRTLLFLNVSESIEYKNVTNGKWKSIDSPMQLVEQHIASWELGFLDKWRTIEQPIVLGTAEDYMPLWHKNTPFIYTPKEVEPPKIGNMRRNIFEIQLKAYYNSKTEFAFRVIGPGIFAGFANFRQDRPADIWLLFYKYLVSRYYIVSNANSKFISNKHSLIQSIGKDERMILFTLLPKYMDLIYFYTIVYYGGIDYKDDLERPPVIGGSRYYLLRKKSIDDNDPYHFILSTILRPDYHTAIDTPAEDAKFRKHFIDMIGRYQTYLHDMSLKTNAELQELTGNTLRPTRRLQGGKRRRNGKINRVRTRKHR